MATRRGLADTLAYSAVAGAGLSFGHDVYRTVKRNVWLFAALALLFGSGLAVWDMTRGGDRFRIVRAFLIDPLLVASSFAAGVVFPLAVLGLGWGVLGLLFQIAMIGVGYRIGARQRRPRLAADRVAADNRAFMAREGLIDVGGRDSTLIDRAGNELIVDDVRSDAILLKVRGRRAVRARIAVDSEGRMLSYAAP